MIRIANDDTAQPSLLPDLTPMLDVIFIVMVFLMLSVNVAPLALPVDLPTMGAEQAEVVEEPNTLAVNVFNESGGWALDGKEFQSWEQLSQALLAAHKADPNQSVIIAGDRNAPMERLVQLLSFLQAQQWPAASIQMEKSSTE
ncbi:ExbD/TolR family protein [Sansalvadorimonas verongulae]|uniref:ExbD/TolR family protein n=1 Tax=Sansalvadorimonas verongulae TaxID=2172824 RepID=UPI0012BBC64A|nr:biopolymer transporter ExbD [Sansalvadorimonas verongulae]MTI13623.1 biopolymer transporter ExbD [Sansalvadorimonas verongulae]